MTVLELMVELAKYDLSSEVYVTTGSEAGRAVTVESLFSGCPFLRCSSLTLAEAGELVQRKHARPSRP